jgi:hypothetical protein
LPFLSLLGWLDFCLAQYRSPKRIKAVQPI